MSHHNICKGNKGFTLIELMVTLAISTLVITIVFWIYEQQQRVQVSQESVVDMQQNMRAAVYLLGQEIRMAGYDPTNDASATITAATATQISFSQDITDDPGTANDGDGDVNDPNESITINFNLATNTLTRQSTAAGVPQPLIQNVEGIEFRYTLEDGGITLVPAANQLEDIRTVDISILVRSTTQENGFVNNFLYTPASGVANNWGPFGDNIRRRLLITTIQCRNMGI